MTRLTMKPGVSFTSTGVLRSPVTAKSQTAAKTSGDVLGARTSSTSFMATGGLKKCSPSRRCGVRTACEISVTDSEDVFVAKTAGGVRVAVTGAGPCAFRVKAMEDALSKNFSSDAIKDIKVPADGLNSDIHDSPEYRAHLITVMAKRAVAAALK